MSVNVTNVNVKVTDKHERDITVTNVNGNLTMTNVIVMNVNEKLEPEHECDKN
jgi:hypothetical protein